MLDDRCARTLTGAEGSSIGFRAQDILGYRSDKGSLVSDPKTPYIM